MSSKDSTAHRNDWIRFYRSAPEGYKAKALSACLSADGVKMLSAVLREMKLESSVDLVADFDATAKASAPKNDE